MTAIALLNCENDPHVVADTLLSADEWSQQMIKVFGFLH
jgi:hypothetical protein